MGIEAVGVIFVTAPFVGIAVMKILDRFLWIEEVDEGAGQA